MIHWLDGSVSSTEFWKLCVWVSFGLNGTTWCLPVGVLQREAASGLRGDALLGSIKMKISNHEVPESDLAYPQAMIAEKARSFGRCKQLTIYPANEHELFGSQPVPLRTDLKNVEADCPSRDVNIWMITRCIEFNGRSHIWIIWREWYRDFESESGINLENAKWVARVASLGTCLLFRTVLLWCRPIQTGCHRV